MITSNIRQFKYVLLSLNCIKNYRKRNTYIEIFCSIDKVIELYFVTRFESAISIITITRLITEIA